MRASDRATARRNLDKRLNSLRNLESLTRPPKGWVRAIREALGMTTAQLGKRIGVTQPRAFDIEKAEVNGSLTIDSLERAARALDCQLVYALVPRKPLEDLVVERARQLARSKLASISHSMALEDQQVSESSAAYQLDDLTRKLLEKRGSALWDEE